MRRAALALALFPIAGSAASLPTRAYVVERLSDGISADDSIGPKRAGLMCLPNGHIRWRDIVPGDRTDRKEIIQDALEDAGLPIVADRPSAARRQLHVRGMVTSATVNLCARQQLLGDRAALSGKAHLEVEWRIEDLSGAENVRRHISIVDRDISPRDAASASMIGRNLISDAARDLANWLKTADISEVAPHF